MIAKQGHNHILHIWIRFFGFLLVVILYLSLGSWTYENKPASILTCHGKTAQQSPIDFGDEVIYNPYLVPSKIHWLNWTVDDFHDVEVPAFGTDSHGWEINFIKKPKSCQILFLKCIMIKFRYDSLPYDWNLQTG